MHTKTRCPTVTQITIAALAILLNLTFAANVDNLAAKARLSATRSLEIPVYKIENIVDGVVTINKDIKSCESCWAGDSGDLTASPIDIIIDFGESKTIDTVIVTTCRLKNQQRLTDFDIYGWAGTDWDGQEPLAVVRGSKERKMTCKFDAISATKICIRLLDNARTTHNFPHISELEIYPAKGPAKRKLTPGGLPRPLEQLKTLDDLRREAERLRKLKGGPDAKILFRRLQLVENKLRDKEEEAKWMEKLNEIDRETKALMSEGVPEWAAAEREALCKYILWIHWWISRQKPDGQFGGGWNDDVELVCGWPLAYLAASDKKTWDSLKLLADGVWNWGPIKKYGYSTYTDVEHSAEEISYSQPRMVVLDYDDPKWSERCRFSTMTVHREFMGLNSKGMLQFKSDWFGYRGGAPTLNEKRNFDVPECAKALKPGLYAAWRGDEEIKKLMLQYGDTWLDAAQKQYKEKLRGLLPSRIDFKTGEPKGVCLWIPVMRATYYHLIGCYLFSRDVKYLMPIRETIREFVVNGNVNELPAMGSFRGREHIGTANQLAVIASMWRVLTGDKTFDSYFAKWSHRLADSMGERYESYYFVDRKKPDLWIREPIRVGAFQLPRLTIAPQFYIGWLATGDKGLLVKGCYNLSCDLTDQWGPLTSWFFDPSEKRVTSNDHSAHSLQTSATMLMMMYTGGYGPIEAKYPYMPVSWENTTRNFAALVLETDEKDVKILACNLEPTDRKVTMRFYELAPGSYRIQRGPDANGDDQMDRTAETLEVRIEQHTGVEITLPSKKVQVIEVRARL